MKKNILTAIAALLMSLILFTTVSYKNSIVAAEEYTKTETIEATISETNIPSDIVITKVVGGKVFTADAVELKDVSKPAVAIKPTQPIAGKPIVKPSIETTTIINKEETTTKIVEETTTQLNTEISEETTTEINNNIWAEKEAEYPVATYIWRYMKDLGWSDAVCAGIMGNMMTEAGGHTLNIKPYLYGGGGSYYGICQWYLPYTTRNIAGTGVETQCNYLRDTIKKEMNTFGYKYSSSMNYSNFLALSSPSEAALAFAKCYERCSSSYYTVRQTDAQKAYKYFVG